MLRGIRRSLALAWMIAATPASAADFGSYVVHDVGTLGGVRGSGAVSSNGAGTSVGYSFVMGTNFVHAMVNAGGAVTDLGTLGGSQSLARAVNTQGWVVGWAFDPTGTFPEAFLWRDGQMLGLGDLGLARSDAQAVSDAGVVVGSAFTALGLEHAFWWSDGVMTDAGTLGGTTSRAYDVNERGVMCGMSSPAGVFELHAFLMKRGDTMIDLGTLGGEAAHAFSINDLDHVVGWSYVSRNLPQSRAFLFRGAGLETLADLGGVSATAFSINNSDVIVGDATTAAEQRVAVIWRQGEIRDLNTLIAPGTGWTLTRAWDISETGVIVGEGVRNGVASAFLLLPAQLTSAPPAATLPLTFAGASPNPVRHECRFGWTLPAETTLRLELFDVRGRRVRLLADALAPAGAGSIAWDGRDESRTPVGSGVYWARLSTRGTHLTRRVAVTR